MPISACGSNKRGKIKIGFEIKRAWWKGGRIKWVFTVIAKNSLGMGDVNKLSPWSMNRKGTPEHAEQNVAKLMGGKSTVE